MADKIHIMMPMTRKISLLILLTFALLQLDDCTGGDGKTKEAANNTGQADSQVSPTINVSQFSAQDLTGNWRSSSEWLGKQAVVINFWGTWCPPCRHEIPDLVKLYAEYKAKGVELISLAVNDTPDKVKEYASANGMNWVLLMAQDQILVDYKVTTGVPTTVFISKSGNEVTRYIGMRDYESLKKGFDAIL